MFLPEEHQDCRSKSISRSPRQTSKSRQWLGCTVIEDDNNRMILLKPAKDWPLDHHSWLEPLAYGFISFHAIFRIFHFCKKASAFWYNALAFLYIAAKWEESILCVRYYVEVPMIGTRSLSIMKDGWSGSSGRSGWWKLTSSSSMIYQRNGLTGFHSRIGLTNFSFVHRITDRINRFLFLKRINRFSFVKRINWFSFVKRNTGQFMQLRKLFEWRAIEQRAKLFSNFQPAWQTALTTLLLRTSLTAPSTSLESSFTRGTRGSW